MMTDRKRGLYMISNNVDVVIMAGGLGTRISSINNKVPKPMIEINGYPILYYQIENLKKNNLTDIILVVGYMYDKISCVFIIKEKRCQDKDRRLD